MLVSGVDLDLSNVAVGFDKGLNGVDCLDRGRRSKVVAKELPSGLGEGRNVPGGVEISIDCLYWAIVKGIRNRVTKARRCHCGPAEVNRHSSGVVDIGRCGRGLKDRKSIVAGIEQERLGPCDLGNTDVLSECSPQPSPPTVAIRDDDLGG